MAGKKAAAKTTRPAGGVKIRCENWFWSRKLQLLLAQVLPCHWGSGITVPWNTRREFLVVQPSVSGGWFFSWATPWEFEACPLPEWSAKALISAYPGATKVA